MTVVVLLGVLSIILVPEIVILISSGIQHLANPEYYALQDIISSVKK